MSAPLTRAKMQTVRDFTLVLEQLMRRLRLRLAYAWMAPDPKLVTEFASDLRRIAQKLDEVAS